MPSLLLALAGNPALPPALVDRLLTLADVAPARARDAREDRAGPEDHADRTDRADTDQDAAVAAGVGVSPEDLADALAERTDLTRAQVRALADRFDSAAIWLAYSGGLRAADVDPVARPLVALALLEEGRGDPAWARLFVPDEPGDTAEVRVRLASCPALPADVADLLAADRIGEVAAELAFHTERTDLLRRLAAHPDPEVRRAVAGNEATPPEVLAALLDDAVEVRQLALGNPATPGEAAARFVGDPELPLRERLATHPGLPDEAYRYLAEDPAPWVRGNLAENPAVGTPLLHRLALDDGHDIRRRIAHHPHVPLDLLSRIATTVRIGPTLLPRIATATPAELADLASSLRPRVRMLVAQHRGLPAPVRDRLAADPDAKVVRSIAPHPGLSPTQLATMVERFGAQVAVGVAANPGAPADLLERLATAQAPAVRALRAIARHPHATPAALAVCLASADPRVSEAAAANPALPPAAMVALIP
ncbi:hypothetical protein [Kitasatospora sp. NPDC097643]|uniref:hypothetical protein n=1 Tax=Kitasatospora sp. NPDC097643 TaxID=3157230 RepID=UPI00332ECEF8